MKLIDKVREAWESLEETDVTIVDVSSERRYAFIDGNGAELLSVSASEIKEAPVYVREKFAIPEKNVFHVLLAFGGWLSEDDHALA